MPYMLAAMTRPFLKMNGLGNDFVVVEARSAPFRPDAAAVRAIAGREHGRGCDQLIASERSSAADAFMRIWNADGGEVSACGNATRCVGWLLLEEGKGPNVTIEKAGGRLTAKRARPARVRVRHVLAPPQVGGDPAGRAHGHARHRPESRPDRQAGAAAARRGQ